MSWLWTSSRRSMRASSAPILWLKPTISVNMMAASLRVSAGAARLLSSDIAAIIGQAAGGCQTVTEEDALFIGSCGLSCLNAYQDFKPDCAAVITRVSDHSGP